MVQESQEARLDEFIIKGSGISVGETEIVRFPTPVAEIARLNDRLFVILSVPNPEADLDYAGTNLWALSLEGKVLWKAPNLNSKSNDQFFHWKCYSDLRIYNKQRPIIDCFVDDRLNVILEASTGRYVTDVEPINWKKDIAEAKREFVIRMEMKEQAMFLESLRLCDASPHNPLVQRSRHPASIQLG